MKREQPMKKSPLAIGLGLSLACVAAVAAVQAQRPAPPEAPGLMGVIKDSAGKPMPGVTVSARAADSTMTTSVYTDDKGAYVFPHLAAGAYKIWAQTVGFATENAVAKLDGAHTVRRALSLKPLADFGAQLTGYEWFSSLPDDTAEHRRMKQVLYVGCSGCHGLEVALQDRFDVQGWTNIIKGMETTTYNGWRGTEDSPAAGLGWEAQIIRYHRDELAKYLAEVRGPDSPALTLNTLPRPAGDAANVVITEYDLPIAERANEPSWYNGSDWSQGPATGMHGVVGVHDVLADAAGNAWITQSRTTFERGHGRLQQLGLSNFMHNISMRAN